MKKLIVWCIKAGEEFSIDNSTRLGRTASLAEFLSRKGHKVTWWRSSFLHSEKKYFVKGYKKYQPNPNENIVLLHSPITYKKNMSISRIIHYKILAREFSLHSAGEEKPDVIVCSWPTADFAKRAIRYGRKNNIPVIVDVRDFWPDTYIRFFPDKLKAIGEICIAPSKWNARRVMNGATAITGVVDSAVDWGCSYAGWKPRKIDRAMYFGTQRLVREKYVTKENLNFWVKKGITSEMWIICFLGSLRKGLDLDTLMHAVKRLHKVYGDIRLVIGGEGDLRKDYERTADEHPAILFGGWLNEAQMNSLMFISKCGAYCIQNTKDFEGAFGNKVVQYISAGLPVLNSLSGVAKKILDANNAGLTYREGDVDDCVSAIERMYRNPEETSKMAANAAALFENEYDSEKANSKYEDYIYEVVSFYRKHNTSHRRKRTGGAGHVH